MSYKASAILKKLLRIGTKYGLPKRHKLCNIPGLLKLPTSETTLQSLTISTITTLLLLSKQCNTLQFTPSLSRSRTLSLSLSLIPTRFLRFPLSHPLSVYHSFSLSPTLFSPSFSLFLSPLVFVQM